MRVTPVLKRRCIFYKASAETKRNQHSRMRRGYGFRPLVGLVVCFLLFLEPLAAQNVPLWGLFETSVTNTKNYGNKFRDVELNATFESPSGRRIPFWGFFDGDGNGGPSRFDAKNPPSDNAGELSGTIWKLRFMPNEKGRWTYSWSFSDNSKSGSGSFDCTASGAKPGVIKPNSTNFHWLQTPDSKPFLPRVWYTMVSELPYRVGDFAPAYYKKAIDRGYNLFVTNILPIWNWTTEARALPSNVPADTDWLIWYQEKPSQGERDDGTVYDTDRMNLFAWDRIEEHVSWLANKGVYVYPFQGFAVKRTVPDYRRPDKFSDGKARWFLKYCMARLAPFYNMIWNYTWEVDPGTQKTDKFGQWIDQYDPWDHMYTTESLNSGSGSGDNFSSNIYDMSTIEVGPDGPYAGNADSVANYYKYKKPIFMIEDYRPLWRTVNQNDNEALDKAWRLICNGSFFAWSEFDYNNWPAKPWNEVFTYKMADYITILYKFIGNETEFANLKPRKDLVNNGAYALAKPGSQYVVYKPNGGKFNVTLTSGAYIATWLDPFTNKRTSGGNVNGPGNLTFTPPLNRHYVLVLKSDGSSGATSEKTFETAAARSESSADEELVANQTGGALFEDNFSGNLSQWEVQQGKATIENGKLILEGNNGHCTVELKNSQNLKNVSIEMDVTIHAFQWGLGSFHVRKAGKPFYHFTIEKYNASAPDFHTRLRIFRNEAEPAFASVNQEYPVNKRKRVRIDVENKTITVYIDGSRVVNYTASDMKDQGSVALHLYKAKWTIDNFVVRSLGASPSPQPAPTPELSRPEGLRVTTRKERAISLSWNAPTDTGTGIDHYNIYRDGKKVAQSSKTAFTNTGLSPDKSYKYQVSAVDRSDKESPKSSSVSARTLPESIPPELSRPEGLRVTTRKERTISLSWNTPTDTGTGIDHYNIYRDGKKVAQSSKTAFTNTGLSPDKSYKYQVSAVDRSDKESPKSSSVSVQTLPENIPPEPENEEKDDIPVGNDTPSGDNDGILFKDNFSGNLSQWDIQKGKAFIQNGKLILEGNNRHCTVELKNSRNLKNISIEMDVTIHAFQWGIGSIHFRKAGKPFYHFTIEKYNASAPDFRTRLRIFKNEAEPAFASVNQEYPVNKRKRVRIDVEDKTIKVYIDGRRILTHKAPDMKDKGSIALHLYKAKWTIDNVVVRSLENSPSPSPSPKPSTTLGRPGRMRATATSDSAISLTWNPPSDVGAGIDHYKIYRNGKKIAQTSKTAFTNTGLSANTAYRYQASVVDRSGKESAKSSSATARTLPGSNPPSSDDDRDDDAPPANDDGILFKDNFSGNLSQWDIQKGKAFIQNGKLILEGNNRHCTVELKNSRNLKNISIEMDVTIHAFQWGIGSIHFRKAGKPFYHFTIEKYNASAPDFRTRLRIFKNEAEPAFASVNQEYPVNKRKRVRIDVEDKTIKVYIDGRRILTHKAPDMKDKGSIALHLYKAKWTIDNVVVRSLGSAPSPSPTSTLGRPGRMRAKATSDRTISLTWNPPSHVGAGIDHYKIYRNGKKIAQTSKTAFTNTGLSANTAYRYQVSVVDRSGKESAKSSSATATTLGSGTALAASTASSTGSSILFEDNFSGNLSQWQVRKGKAFIENGKLILEGKDGLCVVELRNSKDLGNISIEMDVTIRRFQWGLGAIQFRKNGTPFYDFTIQKYNATGDNGFSTKLRIFRNSVNPALASKTQEYPVNTTKKIRIELRDKTVTTYIDNKRIWDYTAKDMKAQGSIVFNLFRAKWAIDNFVVRSLDTSRRSSSLVKQAKNAQSVVENSKIATVDATTNRNTVDTTANDLIGEISNIVSKSLEKALSKSIYEDAEHGTTQGWHQYANGEILNVVDANNAGNRVIKITGDIEQDVFRLGTPSGSDWDNKSEFFAQFSIAPDGNNSGAVYFQVMTTVGIKYLLYSAGVSTKSSNSDLIHVGLGELTENKWYTIVRSLETDLKTAFPTAQLLEVDSLFVYGSLRLDNVILFSTEAGDISQ